jgi:hypothetical protein
MLQVGGIGEKSEHPFARQRHTHRRSKKVERPASHCSRWFQTRAVSNFGTWSDARSTIGSVFRLQPCVGRDAAQR